MPPTIYVLLPSGRWVWVKGKMIRVIVSGTRRSNVAHSMVGETLEEEPRLGSPTASFYVSSTKVSRYIMRLLDEELDATLVIRPVMKSLYRVEVYGGGRKAVSRLREIAESMKALRVPKKRLHASPS